MELLAGFEPATSTFEASRSFDLSYRSEKFGVRRQSEAATALWIGLGSENEKTIQSGVDAAALQIGRGGQN